MRLDSFTPPRRLFREPLACDDLDSLRKIQAEHPGLPLCAFSSWNDARQWLNVTGAWREAADALLRPVLTAFKLAPDCGWFPILLFLFWPHLDRIARQLEPLDSDNIDEIESLIHWTFLQVVHRIDLDKRQARLGQKLLNDIRHEVREAYDHERERAANAEPLPAQTLQDEPDDTENADFEFCDPGFERCDLEHDFAWARTRLKSLVRRGRLSAPDYLILVGCHLYGHSLHVMAARLGLSYEAAKKRQQRATRILREDKETLSPSRGHWGL